MSEPGIGNRVLVISGNRGLGLEIVRRALSDGLSVLATCRKSSEELDGLDGDLHVKTGIDLTDESAPEDLVGYMKEIGWEKCDAVICITGLFTFDSFEELYPQKNVKMYEVCALGPLRLISHLVKSGALASSSKVALITSEGGSISLRTDEEGGGNYGHHMSKAAQNMMGKILAIDLKPKGIPVVCLHPGFIKTSMTEDFAEAYDKYNAVGPEVAAPRILEAVCKLTLENTGRFVAPMGTESLGFGVLGLDNPDELKPFSELPW